MSDFEAGKFVGDIIAANAEGLFQASKKFISDKGSQIKARLSNTFVDYLTIIGRKYSSTKTIIYRDTPQSIKKFYEPIDLYNDKINLATPKIADILFFNCPVVITGTGGSGKSTFLKYLLLDTIETTNLIPIFVELRVVEQEQKSLIEYISNSLQLHKVDLGSEYLKYAFESGNFLFLLDGFDELSQDYARRLSVEIDNMSQLYSKCTFILTSRPGQDFISWSNFIELKTKPLTLVKSISLIDRLNFDEDIKEKFIDELKGKLYESHQSFFENPLLLSIMLLTYRDSASIPSELHNFYALAFEALYYRHDASKTFKRPTLTNLPVDKGKDIMSSFSLITYLNNNTIFTSFQLKKLLVTAMQLSSCECDVDELISDLLRAYCMLLQDGLKYQYTHRSFQEYFAACYLVAADDAAQIKLIKQFCQKADTDITLQLAYGMNPKMIEEKLVIPFLKDFKKNIGYTGDLTKEVFIRFAKHYFTNVSIHSHMGLSIPLAGSKSSASALGQRLNLSITRFILSIYNIDTKFNGKPYEPTELIKLRDTKARRMEFSIDEAFAMPEVLNWFMQHSVEVRILSELMNLEVQLNEKSKKNAELFDSLLNIKPTVRKRNNLKS